MKTTITRVGYFNGKFLYSPTGWPEKPKYDVKCHSTHSCICASLAFENGANRDVVDGYDDNCPHRYQKALSSAIAQAVEFEDQEGILKVVFSYVVANVNSSWSFYWFRRHIKDGLYTIPPTEIEVVERSRYEHEYLGSARRIVERVARLVTQQSEPSPVEETQEELAAALRREAISFGVWYSGMTTMQVRSAYDRFKKEGPRQEKII